MFDTLARKPDPDAPLVAQAARGEIVAFDRLVRRYQERLTMFVRSRLDPVIDAEDVAQEIFMAAWCQLPKFRGRSTFKTWLFGIALNLCADAMRRHRLVKLVMVDRLDTDGDSAPWESQADPSDWPAMLAERDAVRRGLDTLPETERQVLELYYFGQLNLPEISELLAVNLSTLKYRFYQAHRRLRRVMDAPGCAVPRGAGSSGQLLPPSVATGRQNS